MATIVIPPTGGGPFVVYTWQASSGAAFASTEALVTTAESTASMSFTDLATVGPAVTVTVPASGMVRVSIGARIAEIGGSNDGGYMGFAMSGANTAAASLAQIMRSNLNGGAGAGNTVGTAYSSFLLTGLTPGSTTFTAKYASGVGATITFNARRLRVEPVGADLG